MSGKSSFVPLLAKAYTIANVTRARTSKEDIEILMAAVARASVWLGAVMRAPDAEIPLEHTALFSAASILIERGPGDTPLALLRAAVDIYLQARIETAAPGTPQATAEYWWRQGQME